ncbi:hypothetical protein J6590_100385 [Homalodisca vitripennis]|nr:hypothetical protein J6590_100385 [Homalodisca vitripennis]
MCSHGDSAAAAYMALAWPVIYSCRLGSPADRKTTVFLTNLGAFVSWWSVLFWKASSAFLVVLEVCGCQAGAAYVTIGRTTFVEQQLRVVGRRGLSIPTLSLCSVRSVITSSSRVEFNGVINRGGEKEWGQSRAEPSSTDKSRKFLTNSVHAADSDLSSERF